MVISKPSCLQADSSVLLCLLKEREIKGQLHEKREFILTINTNKTYEEKNDVIIGFEVCVALKYKVILL